MADINVKFYHVANLATLGDLSTLSERYAGAIIFVDDVHRIWANGEWFGVTAEMKATLDKVGTNESAINLLKTYFGEHKYAINGIKVGDTEAWAGKTDALLTINATNGITATATQNGLTLGLDASALATKEDLKTVTDAAAAKVKSVTATANKGIIVEGTATDPTVGIKLDTTTAGNVTLSVGANGLKGEVDLSDVQNKIDNVTGENAIDVSVNNKVAKVTLKTDSTGNVALTNGANGLKANVTIPVTGVKSGDKVLALNGTELTSTLSINYNTASKEVELKGIDGEVISKFDAQAFVKDGMIQSAELVTVAESGVTGVDVPYIKLTFNTDSGKDTEPIRFSVKNLVDVYDGANLKLSTAYKDAASYTANNVAVGASVDTVVAELKAGVKQAIDAAATAQNAGVTSFGGAKGAISVDEAGTTDGDVVFSVDSSTLKGSVKGIKSAAFTEATAYATAAQGTLAGTALQSISTGTDGTYVTTTVSSKGTGTTQTVAVAVTTQAVATATTDKDGLATAKDVKDYVDGQAAAALKQVKTTGGAANTVQLTAGAVASGEQTLTLAVNTKKVADATADADGLAMAKDVKDYVDGFLKWTEITA